MKGLVTTAGGSHRANGSRPSNNRKYRDQFRGNPTGSCRRGQSIALGNGAAGGRSLMRDIHSNLELSRSLVRFKPPGDCLPLGIGMDDQALASIGKDSARPMVGQREHNHGACHRPIVFILDLDDWLARRAQFDAINGAFAVQDQNLQLGG